MKGRLKDVIKMSAFPKLIYRLSLVKISIGFFIELDKMMLKFIWRVKVKTTRTLLKIGKGKEKVTEGTESLEADSLVMQFCIREKWHGRSL